jgi:hypothetical protein
MKLRWHKFTHWEYWPTQVVYAPTFFLWMFFAIRFLSIRFYKRANPAIENGGLFGDSKKKIYDLLSSSFYPKTVLVEKGRVYDFKQLLDASGLDFPLIAKPDIGQRGVLVELVFSIEEIERYQKKVQQNFLLQERCTYPNEVGLFYCRKPNESHGRITGLTMKNFLTLSGNGVNTIRELLESKPRFAMQIPKLQGRINFDEVLAVNESKCIVPFGNHNRGTEFLDGRQYITPQLEATFDAILSKIDGFYYGRLDIRYNTLEELEQGLNFSIIEINGAKSEPTHIYDPKHSFWFGQKEIFKHQILMFTVMNQKPNIVEA